MAEAEPDYESRQAEILQFVSKNPNCTKADVIRHMIGRSAVTTTHAILKDIIRDGKINVYKKNLQTHLLTINEDNEFNRVNKEFSEIETCIDTIDEKIDKINRLPEFKKWQKNKEDARWLHIQRDDFEKTFLIEFYMTIYGYLVRINNRIKSEKDSAILYNKIIKLIVKMTNRSSKTLSWDLLKGTDKESFMSMAREDNLATFLEVESTQALENFKNKTYIDRSSKQKTKEPRKKSG